MSAGAVPFAFYGRVSTEDMQDPVASRLWQLERAESVLPPGAQIVVEYFDIDETRALPWQRRAEASRLLAALADPNRGFGGVVIGEPARAFHGNQYGLTYPLFPHYGVELWVPEVGGRVDPDSEAHDLLMQLFGGMSKGERNRTRIRVRSSMASQTQHQGRFLGGRPPYGYRLARSRPHPNPRKAAEGVWLYKLVPDLEAAPVVLRIYEEHDAGRGFDAIARGLNGDGIPCPSAHDPGRNRHRSGERWQASTVRAILTNPRYGGHQVWGRARRHEVLLDPTDVAAGTTTIRRSTTEDSWARSVEPSHDALVPSDLLDRVQARLKLHVGAAETRAARGGDLAYPLHGLMTCAHCGRKMHGEHRGDRRYYRCGTKGSARAESSGHPASVYVREDAIVSRLDSWLANAFSAEAAGRAAADLGKARGQTPGEAAEERSAKRTIEEANKKIPQLELAIEKAIEEGLPTNPLVRLIAKHERAREEARTTIARLRRRRPGELTPEQFRQALADAERLATALAQADDAQRQCLYAALGVEISYDPITRTVHAAVAPKPQSANGSSGASQCVGGGTPRLATRLPRVADVLTLLRAA